MLAALVGALLPFLLWLTIGEEHRRDQLRESSLLDLRAEIEQNQQHQEISTYVSLEEDAYKRFRRRGFLTELRTEVRQTLRELYSRIHEKNELILYHRSALASGREALITDGLGQNPRKITEIITEIRGKIDERIGAVLPIFQAYELGNRSLRMERWLRRGEDASKTIALIFLLAATYYGTQIIVPISSQSTTIVETNTSTVTFSTNSVQQSTSCTTFQNGTHHCAYNVTILQPIKFTEYITGYQSRIVPTQQRAEAEYWQSIFETLALIFFIGALGLRGIQWSRNRQQRHDKLKGILKK